MASADMGTASKVFDMIIRDASDDEDGVFRVSWDSMSDGISCCTRYDFRFAVDGHLLRNAAAGGSVGALCDAIHATYVSAVEGWLENGPWL